MPGQLAAALYMAGRGFRVFPVRPYGKKPAVAAFEQVATTDETRIREWWTNPTTHEEYEYNIGVLCNDMVVVDIDTKKGQHALDNYNNVGGHFDTLTVATPTGGYHCYFDGPDSGLRVDIVAGVDIRSHNGYVLGPGSFTDPTLANDPDVKAKGYYGVSVDKPLAWIPADIERQLRPPGVRAERNTSVEIDTPTAIDNATVWLQTAEPASWGAGGDIHTFKIAAKLVRDYALSEETTFQLMATHWNDRCIPHGWPLDLLWAKVENAGAYGTGDMGTARPEATFGGVQVIPVPEPLKPLTARERGVYMGNAINPGDIRPRPWVVDRLLIEGEVTGLVGGGAVGKSLFELAMAAHFALGKDFGAYKLHVPGVALRSVIYNAEDDIEEASRRLLAVCIQYELDYFEVRKSIALMDDSQGDLVLAYLQDRVAVTNDAAMQFVIQTLMDERADIAFFDPLLNIHALDENFNPHMKYLVNNVLKVIARRCRVAVMFAHHIAKGSSTKDRGDSDVTRGAGSIINSSRTAIVLSGPDQSDMDNYRIDKNDRSKFVRVDDAKANMYAKSNEAIMWMRWEGVRIQSGDMVGVPNVVNMGLAAEAQKRDIAVVLHEVLVGRNIASINLAESARVLAELEPLYAKMTEGGKISSLRNLIKRSLAGGVQVGSDKIVCTTDEKGNVLIKLQ